MIGHPNDPRTWADYERPRSLRSAIFAALLALWVLGTVLAVLISLTPDAACALVPMTHSELSPPTVRSYYRGGDIRQYAL